MKKRPRLLKKILIGIALLPLVLVIVYLLGPRPKAEQIDNTPLTAPKEANLEVLAEQIARLESENKDIKPDNEARIVWANDSLRSPTAYSIVYLHGFSASQGEAMPMHYNIAQRYGCHLYLPRLVAHGLSDKDAFLQFNARSAVESAKEAIAKGKALGQKVILMSCSTGSTLALYLAANDPDIAGIIALSPNIALADPNAWMLSGPWGLQIARLIFGGKYRQREPDSKETDRYWNSTYRLEGLIQLKLLMDMTMRPEIFAQVKQPLFLAYYYKNDAEQDATVSVAAMLKMYEQLGSPAKQKRKLALPEAQTHVIASQWHSKQLQDLEQGITQFMEQIMGLQPLQ